MTVRELIDALQKCPDDSMLVALRINPPDGSRFKPKEVLASTSKSFDELRASAKVFRIYGKEYPR